MARGYHTPDVRRRIISTLADSDGMSGSELARKLNMSRVTATKYLEMLASDGTIRQRDMGNITVWSLEPEHVQYAR